MKNAVVSGLVTGFVVVAAVVVDANVDWGAVGAGVSSLSLADINAGARELNRFLLPLVVLPIVLYGIGLRFVDWVSGSLSLCCGLLRSVR